MSSNAYIQHAGNWPFIKFAGGENSYRATGTWEEISYTIWG